MAEASTIGSGIGTVAGAAIGSAIAPGVGTGIGAAIGGGLGKAVGGMVGNAGKKDGGQLPLSDPEQLALLAEIHRRRQQAASGVLEPGAQQAAQQLLGATQSNLAKVSGGDVGGTVSALLQAQKLGGRNINQLLGQQQNQEKFFLSAESDLQNRVAQRKLDIQYLEQLRRQAQQAENATSGNENAANLAATAGPDLGAMLKNFVTSNGGSNIGSVGGTSGPSGALPTTTPGLTVGGQGALFPNLGSAPGVLGGGSSGVGIGVIK